MDKKPTETKAPAKARAPKAAPKVVKTEKIATRAPKAAEAIEAKAASSFAELKAATTKAAPQPKADPNAPRVQKLDPYGRAYAKGGRKDAGARIWIKPGTGKITVNGRDQTIYFARPVLRMMINQPFQIAKREGQYDVMVNVKGGGLSGQAGAVRHGIAQALRDFEPELHKVMKDAGLLTRDARVVERKKYGRAKARRRFQFSKR